MHDTLGWIRNGLGRLGCEQLDVVLEGLYILKVWAVDVSKTCKLLVDDDVCVLIIHKSQTATLIVSDLQ